MVLRNKIVWIGDMLREEFAPAYCAAAMWAEVIAVADLDAAMGLPEVEKAACLVLVQEYPAQWNEKTVEALRSRNPTLPLVTITGSWSEGEKRTGVPLQTARIPWSIAPDYFSRELATLARSECPSFGLPPACSDEDRYLSPGVADALTLSNTGVGIVADDPAVRQLLLDVCRRLHAAARGGLEATAAANPPVDVVLWGMPCSHPRRETQALRFSRLPAQTRRLALAHFPRRDDLTWARSHGFQEVLALPVDLDTLGRRITAVAGESIACNRD